MKNTSISIILTIVLLCFCGLGNAQSTWNGTSWSGVTPGPGTGSYSFIVNGPDCTIGNANMTSLTIEPGAWCTLTANVYSTTVDIPYDVNNISYLAVEDTLFVTNLTNLSYLTGNGTGTVMLSTGIYSQTDGTNFGSCDMYNFNILSGSVNFPYFFAFQNMTISQGATVNVTYTGNQTNPFVFNLLTINGTLINTYKYTTGVRPTTYYYFNIGNLIINPTGNFNSTNGYSQISQTFQIGGSISAASNIYSYNFNFNITPNSSTLGIFGNANVKFSDLSNANPAYKYLGTLNVSGTATFTVDKSLTVNSLNANSGGTILNSGPNSITATTIGPVGGRLILPGATLSSPGTSSLSLNGSNAAIAYINKPAWTVNLSGGSDTLRNCNFQDLAVSAGSAIVNNTSAQDLTVSTGSSAIVNNTSAYKIGKIDASATVTIQSLPFTDTLLIKSATGSLTLNSPVRVNRLVNIASGAPGIISGGNLIMRDSSNLYFTADGQINGNIQWQRRYYSSGYIFFGVPFPGLKYDPISIGGISQQSIFAELYNESLSATRWIPLTPGDMLQVGKGYALASAVTTGDTLVFTGNPVLDNVTVSGLTYTTSNGSTSDDQRGYGLVANPFTAPISVSQFLSDNPSLNAIYYYDNLGKDNGQYIAYSSGVFTPGTWSTKNEFKINGTYLAPNQAFFVKIPAADSISTGSVLFGNDQITSDLNNNFLQSDLIPLYIRLIVNNTSGNQNDNVIRFNPSATKTYNPAFDCYKLVSNNCPIDIYSFKGNNRFAIQTIAPDTSEKIVPIGLIVQTNEKHTLHIDNFDAISPDINVYMYDNATSKHVNLRDSAYSVNLTSGTYENRFSLVFKTGEWSDTTRTGTKLLNDNKNIVVYSQLGNICVYFIQPQQSVTIQVFDITGRILYNKLLDNATGSISLGSYTVNNVYVVKITGNGLSKINKLLLQ